MSSITMPSWSRSPGRAATRMTDAHAPARALLVDADEPLVELLGEWLGEQGCRVVVEREPAARPGRYDLILADVPSPRGAGAALLQRLGRQHPGTPILALSSAFFPGIEATGPLARSLGVAAV